MTTTTYTVGDSIANGIGRALNLGQTNLGRDGAHIADMADQFTRVTASVQSGDVVIVSAGYNDAGTNGLTQPQITELQGRIQALRAKGAAVVIPGLRTSGMVNNAAGNFGDLNDNGSTPGRASKVNDQLRAIATATGATFSAECTTQANGQANGDPHAFAGTLATICRTAARGPVAPGNAIGGGTSTDSDTPGASTSTAAAASTGGGIGEMFQQFFTWISNAIMGIVNAIAGLFSSNSNTATASTTPTTDSSAQPSSDPDRARSQALAAGRGNSAAGTGTNVAAASAPLSLPAPTGPAIRGVQG